MITAALVALGTLATALLILFWLVKREDHVTVNHAPRSITVLTLNNTIATIGELK